VIYQPSSCAGFPIVLSTPGSYRLGNTITGCAGKNGIEIAASNVSLDLAGFTVTGVASSLDGIHVNNGINVVNVSNGFVVGWGSDGIDMGNAQGHIVEDVMSAANTGRGIVVPNKSTVTRSQSYNNGGEGIENVASAVHVTITDCDVANNGEGGIIGQATGILVRDCTVANNGGVGIDAGASAQIIGNNVHSNTQTGIRVGDVCHVEGNSSARNGGVGVVAAGSGGYCVIQHNNVSGNNGGGMLIASAGALVDSNLIAGNFASGINVSDALAGSPSVITRNTATGNAGADYLLGSGNDVGPIQSAASASSPLANISD
jgi:hypothetical protein